MAPPANDLQYILMLIGQQLEDFVHVQTGSPDYPAFVAQTWPPSVVIPYLNLGLLEAINLKPSCNPVSRTLTLVGGSAQSLPAGDLQLIEVISNSQGGAVDSVMQDRIDNLLPNWQAQEWKDNYVQQVILDPRNPKVFYVFPPQPVPPVDKLNVIVSTTPALLTADTGIFPLDHSYWPAMVEYGIYRCLKESTTIPNAQAKADACYKAFMTGLGIKAEQEQKVEKEGA
jgi:hypothetical protein